MRFNFNYVLRYITVCNIIGNDGNVIIDKIY